MDISELRRRLTAGEVVDLRTGDDEDDDPARADRWSSDREVPADLLVELFTAPGEGAPANRRILLVGARISGTLHLLTATLTRGVALLGCAFMEPPIVMDAELLDLALSRSHLPGLNAVGMRCRRSVLLNDGFTATGEVQLHSAQIGGGLDCNGGTFTKAGNALTADQLVVSQSVHCGNGFTATGEVRLVKAQIGVLDLAGGTFTNPDGPALNGDGLVAQDMRCGDGFRATGEVRLVGAQIGELDLAGGTFTNPNGYALIADRLVVTQSMFCGDGFTATGEVRLIGAHIGGQLACAGATFTSPGGIGLDLERVTVKGDAVFHPRVFTDRLALTRAHVGGWHDNAVARRQPMSVSGFQYDLITGTDSPGERLAWLERNVPTYEPQPYEQLATVYTREGDDAAARQVLIGKQRRRRSRHRAWWKQVPSKAWSWFLRTTIGYGYRPWLVLWWLGGLVLGGWGLFRHEHDSGRITPASGTPADAEFSAFRYTVDLLLPVAGLQERAAFAAIGSTAWYAFVFTLAGWLLALTVVAGLTGLFKRN